MRSYLVGGAVRDTLLGLPVKERDWVVVGATPEQLLDQGYQPVGKDFPVFLHPKTHEEYALARTERKVGKGYKGFECYAAPEVTLEEDLKRRDLTLNAIAQTDEGELIDPFQGQADIQAKVLRHVSPAFEEDPVRLLRVARFAARFYDFSIADETYALMQKMVDAGEVDALVPERVWQEWQKALITQHPTRFIEVLQAVGAFQRLLPRLAKEHTVMTALETATRLTSDPVTRFAAFIHDCQQAQTVETINCATIITEQFKIPNVYAELAHLVLKLHEEINLSAASCAEEVLALIEKADALRRPDRFLQCLVVSHAIAGGEGYAPCDFLKSALAVVVAVEAKPFVAQGLKGEAIAAALKTARIAAIKALNSP